MATRSLTKIYDKLSGNLLCTMYCGFDGSPRGVGANIRERLYGVTVVDGVVRGVRKPYLNSMGRVAAALCSSRSKYEIIQNDARVFVDYTYSIHVRDGKLLLVVESDGSELYRGLLDDFDPNADFNQEE